MLTAILIGPPGSGKSSVGRALGQRLKVAFADTDNLIEKNVLRVFQRSLSKMANHIFAKLNVLSFLIN